MNTSLPKSDTLERPALARGSYEHAFSTFGQPVLSGANGEEMSTVPSLLSFSTNRGHLLKQGSVIPLQLRLPFPAHTQPAKG